MAFQMNYTTAKNANYPQSYWRIGSFQLDRNTQRARVRFDCYYDEAARDTSVESNILEYKNYVLTDDNFVSVFESSGDTRAAIYAYAKACVEGPLPEEGEPDTRVSFFAAAVDV